MPKIMFTVPAEKISIVNGAVCIADEKYYISQGGIRERVSNHAIVVNVREPAKYSVSISIKQERKTPAIKITIPIKTKVGKIVIGDVCSYFHTPEVEEAAVTKFLSGPGKYSDFDLHFQKIDVPLNVFTEIRAVITRVQSRSTRTGKAGRK